MKRCPQCNRVEPDNSLAFCRIDGTSLVSDSLRFSSEAGTARLGSDYAGAEHEFKRAIAFDPGSAHIHMWYDWYLGLLADLTKA